MLPLLGFKSEAIIFNKVDFPLPFGPQIASASDCCISKLRSLNKKYLLPKECEILFSFNFREKSIFLSIKKANYKKIQ